eukprot:scpid26776/ scgid31908/ 
MLADFLLARIKLASCFQYFQLRVPCVSCLAVCTHCESRSLIIKSCFVLSFLLLAFVCVPVEHTQSPVEYSFCLLSLSTQSFFQTAVLTAPYCGSQGYNSVTVQC